MGLANRIIIFLYGCIVACVSFAALALCEPIQALRLPLVDRFLMLLQSCFEEEESVYFFGVLILLSLYVLAVCVYSKKKKEPKEMLLLHGQSGDVHVQLQAIQKLLEQTAMSILDVRDAHAEIATKKEQGDYVALKIALKIAVSKDKNVREITTELEELIVKELKNIFDLDETNFTLKITVDDLTNQNSKAKGKFKRVV